MVWWNDPARVSKNGIHIEGDGEKVKKRLVSLLAAGMVLAGTAGAAMTASAAGTWARLRGYDGDMGSVSASGGTTSLTGYGGVQYTERIPVEEGTTITLTMSPKKMLSMYGNLFTVALLDKENSFVGSRYRHRLRLCGERAQLCQAGKRLQ